MAMLVSGRVHQNEESTNTPLKINMEHNHGGLVPIIFLSKWVICRFHVNLPGCIHQNEESIDCMAPWFYNYENNMMM